MSNRARAPFMSLASRSRRRTPCPSRTRVAPWPGSARARRMSRPRSSLSQPSIRRDDISADLRGREARRDARRSVGRSRLRPPQHYVAPSSSAHEGHSRGDGEADEEEGGDERHEVISLRLDGRNHWLAEAGTQVEDFREGVDDRVPLTTDRLLRTTRILTSDLNLRTTNLDPCACRATKNASAFSPGPSLHFATNNPVPCCPGSANPLATNCRNSSSDNG